MDIFLFTALSASGKTTISKAISERLDLPRIDLHQILHSLATEQGFPRAREWVMSVGLEDVLELTRLRLFEELELSENIRGVIIDEIIDIETLNLIRSKYKDSNLKIFYIRANRHDRVRFVAKRIEPEEIEQAKEEVKFIDNLKHALGVRYVIEQADYRILNFGKVEDAIELTSKIVGDILRNQEGAVRVERGS